MKTVQFFLFSVLLLTSISAKARTLPTEKGIEGIEFEKIKQERILYNPYILSGETDSLKNRKWVTALCAFPFPLGVVGAHRVLLGTKPWVPIVYVATLGGCFGLLPLVDFIIIVSSKDISQYKHNPGVFMWAK